MQATHSALPSQDDNDATTRGNIHWGNEQNGRYAQIRHAALLRVERANPRGVGIELLYAAENPDFVPATARLLAAIRRLATVAAGLIAEACRSYADACAMAQVSPFDQIDQISPKRHDSDECDKTPGNS